MTRIYVIAGGRGRRLGRTRVEKPLVRVAGVPMLARVLSALRGVEGLDVEVAVSPTTPRTARFCCAHRVAVVETPGAGYSADVGFLTHRTPRFATVSSDLPFLRASTVERFVGSVGGSTESRVGLLPSTYCRFPIPRDVAWSYGPHDRRTGRLVGINWVVAGADAGDRPYLFDDPELEFNVNRPIDLARARRHARRLAGA